jgi:hypothetical protein
MSLRRSFIPDVLTGTVGSDVVAGLSVSAIGPAYSAGMSLPKPFIPDAATATNHLRSPDPK